MPKACVIIAITCLAAPKKPTTVSTQTDKSTLGGYATHVITTSFTTTRPSSKNPAPREASRTQKKCLSKVLLIWIT